MSETTTPPDIDPAKLDEWRLIDAENVTPDESIRHVLNVEGCRTAGDVLDAFDGHHGNEFANPYKLSDVQAATLRGGIVTSLEDFGLPPDALCPWLMPPLAEADTPVVVETPPADPLSPEALAEYDQETARLVAEAEAEVTELENVWEDKHGEAALAKKEFENHRDKMRSLIRERTANRGKRDLFTGVKGGIPVGETAAAPAVEESQSNRLMLEYPLEFRRWERYGVTEKMIEIMNGGVTKEHGTHPLFVYGDIARFCVTSTGFERRLTDLKGFGPKLFDKWQEAEAKFWQDWPNLVEQFAAEKGVSLDPEPPATPAEVPADAEGQPGAGAGDGAEGGDGHAEAGAAAAPEPADEHASPKKKAGGKKGKRKAAA